MSAQIQSYIVVALACLAAVHRVCLAVERALPGSRFAAGAAKVDALVESVPELPAQTATAVKVVAS